MSDPGVKNEERRSFFKWFLLAGAALAVEAGSYGSSLLAKEKDSTVSQLGDAATVITDASKGNHHRLKTSQNFHLANPINAVDGQRIIWEITQDDIGNRQMSMGDKFVIGADLKKVTLSTSANKTNYLTAIYNKSADQWHVVAFIAGY